MTTYILHGGNTTDQSPFDQDFYSQFTQSVDKDPVSITCCYWAQNQEKWENSYKKTSDNIAKQTNKKLHFKMAHHEKELYQQLPDSDVIYFHGGSNHLISQLKNSSKFRHLLNGKIYIGSSMGAYLVSTHYMVPSRVTDQLEVKNGLGLLPFSTVCHWDISNMKRRQRVKLLQKHSPNLPILTLDEYKYTKIVY